MFISETCPKPIKANFNLLNFLIISIAYSLRLFTPVPWPPDENWLIGKDPDAGKDWRQEEKGMIEAEMVGWHHRLSGHEFEQAPGDAQTSGVLQPMRSQRVRHDWGTEMN